MIWSIRVAAALTVLLVAMPGWALVRSPQAVRAAIHYSGPSLPQPVVRAYAAILRKEAIARHFDPLTPISMVYYESRWRAGVEDGAKCIGLGQICLTNYRFCTEGGFESPRCLAQKASLKVGTFNLRIVAMLITANRKFCRDKTGHPALFARWLSSYQGSNKPRRGVWCNMKRNSKGVWYDLKPSPTALRVMKYRHELIRHLRRKGLA